MEDIAKLLRDEVRQQKQTFSGVHGRTGKRGYVGKMLFPTDIMSRRDKYNYRKAGKVEITNMYDNIMSYEEFMKLDEESQRKTLTEYRKRFSNKEIKDKWGLGDYEYYTKTVNRLGVRTQSRKSTPRKTTEKKDTALPPQPTAAQEETVSIPTYVVAQSLVDSEKEEGLTIAINGEYTTKALVKKLEKIALMLDDEPGRFKIEFKVREVESEEEHQVEDAIVSYDKE